MCHLAEAELLEEEAEMNQGGSEPGKGGLRRRRRTYSHTLPEHLKSGKQYGQENNQHKDGKIGKGYLPVQASAPRMGNSLSPVGTVLSWGLCPSHQGK